MNRSLGELPGFNGDFVVQWYISGKNFHEDRISFFPGIWAEFWNNAYRAMLENLSKIPRLGSGCGWLQNFKGVFLFKFQISDL